MGPSFLAAGKLAESGVDYFYQGGRPTIGTGGSILFSNTTALVDASLVVTNSGAMTVADSTVTISTNCTLAEGTTINWSSNTVGSVVNVGGALSLPANATFTGSGSIGKNDTWTLFTATGGITGSPAAWTVSPVSHRVAIDGTTLILAPMPPRGTVISVR